jgi:hypothetical protein
MEAPHETMSDMECFHYVMKLDASEADKIILQYPWLLRGFGDPNNIGKHAVEDDDVVEQDQAALMEMGFTMEHQVEAPDGW